MFPAIVVVLHATVPAAADIRTCFRIGVARSSCFRWGPCGALAVTSVPPSTKQTAAGDPAFAGGPAFVYVFDFARSLLMPFDGLSSSIPAPAACFLLLPEFSPMLISLLESPLFLDYRRYLLVTTGDFTFDVPTAAGIITVYFCDLFRLLALGDPS